MSDTEVSDFDTNVASDEEIEDNETEVISDDPSDESDLDQSQEDSDLEELRSKSGHQWEQMPLNQSIKGRRKSMNVLSRKPRSKVTEWPYHRFKLSINTFYYF